MARCERPGCAQAAEVAFGFQAEPYVIWLDAPDADVGERRRAGLLCRRHADAMVVPVGWTLDDRRQPVPRLFATTATATATATTAADATPAEPSVERRPASRRTRRPRHSEDTLFPLEPGEATVAEHVDGVPADGALVDDADAVDAEPVDAEPVDATPWRPVFDTDSDLGGLLAATSPLLSRAFRGRDRRDPEGGR